MLYSARQFILNIAFACPATALFFVGSTLAHAQSETFTTFSNFGCQLDNNDFYVPTFNTALGTLDSVDVDLTFKLKSDINVIDTTGSSESFTNATITVPIDVNSLGAFDFDTNLTASHSGTAQPGSNTYPLYTALTTDQNISGPSDFSSWEGQASDKIHFTVTKGATTVQGTTNSNGLFFGGSASEYGQVKVTYTYSPNNLAVPEPSGKYFAGIVGLAMALVFLRRKSLLLEA